MSLTLKGQIKKIIAHADKNGVAALDEGDYYGEDEKGLDRLGSVVSSLIEAVDKRNAGDIFLAVGGNGIANLTDGYPEEDGVECIRGCGCGCGTLLYLFISFKKKNLFVMNEMKSIDD